MRLPSAYGGRTWVCTAAPGGGEGFKRAGREREIKARATSHLPHRIRAVCFGLYAQWVGEEEARLWPNQPACCPAPCTCFRAHTAYSCVPPACVRGPRPGNGAMDAGGCRVCRGGLLSSVSWRVRGGLRLGLWRHCCATCPCGRPVRSHAARLRVCSRLLDVDRWISAHAPSPPPVAPSPHPPPPPTLNGIAR